MLHKLGLQHIIIEFKSVFDSSTRVLNNSIEISFNFITQLLYNYGLINFNKYKPYGSLVSSIELLSTSVVGQATWPALRLTFTLFLQLNEARQNG